MDEALLLLGETVVLGVFGELLGVLLGVLP